MRNDLSRARPRYSILLGLALLGALAHGFPLLRHGGLETAIENRAMVGISRRRCGSCAWHPLLL